MNTTYNTKQKQLILAFMKENKNEQFTCDNIADMLKQMGTPVGKTTVYRYLDRLANSGKVRKITGGNSKSALFQFVDEEMNCDSHMHLKCLGCGEFIHLGCDFMHGVNEHISKHHHFTVDNSKTVLYGMCEKCSEQ